MATNNTSSSNDDAQSSLDAVLQVVQLLSSLTLSHDDAQSLIEVITDEIQAATLPAVHPAPAPIVPGHLFSLLFHSLSLKYQLTPAAIVLIVVAPAVQIQATVPPAVQPAPATIVQAPPTLEIQATALPAVQTYPTPMARSGFYCFLHLPLTEVIINAAAGPFYLITHGCRVVVFETWCIFSLVPCSYPDFLAGNAHPLM
ncbi:uncharacterized protein EDB93DRAFT_1253115 [Suillus bovinus]|uniref:uncharacterized protein n=1 Tax=Suillus bovinus TaxID=48563 RepID=UPI001B8764FB|nr:uncharacterized protein EDB93DRAFT_1253115 [Suillus bovinus]KAG2139186.1 hypothetical protein EDB93DRAFT_1253115 [Suillus bovinus]